LNAEAARLRDAPLLTLVIASRNDAYMGDSTWRLATTINFLAAELASLGRLMDAEVLVVDWGSEVPLHRVLPLTPEGKIIARFLLVPPHHPATRANLSGAPPWNVGYRRARGTFIAQSGNDILWPAAVFRNLFPLLEGAGSAPPEARRTLIAIRRRQVPWEFVSRNPSLAGIRAFLDAYGARLPADPIGRLCLSPAGTLLTHRDNWLAMRGWDEAVRYWGYTDVDMVLRFRLRYRARDLGAGEGCCVYHLQHNPPDRPVRRIPRDNPLSFGPYAANGPDWGLGGERFAEHPSAEPMDVSGLAGGDTDQPGHYRLRHLGNIIRHTFPLSPLEAANALLLYARAVIPSPGIKGFLGYLRLPHRLRRQPSWARRIRGPWDREGKG
jgi:hypothetical protein